MELPSDTPDDVVAAAAGGPRVPQFDPTVGIPVVPPGGDAPHRLVVIGDSLSQGFQSGAIFNTDLSYPAIIAHQLGRLDQFRFPRYGGPGGLPLNIELLLRTLEERFGPRLDLWEVPLALFAARAFMDQVEDYWERGPGSEAPTFSAINHNLSVYGWDLRDALTKTAQGCEDALHQPHDDLISQIVENNGERAALRVLPRGSDAEKRMTAFDAAAELGKEGIETLIVFLGANNALRTVTELRVEWSGNNFRDPDGKREYTVWQPEHFASEYAEVLAAIRKINAQHVILCTVPHVTIAPIAHGLGGKIEIGSRYFPYYARPWVRDTDFDPQRDQHITGAQAWAVDTAIDVYNDGIEQAVANASGGEGLVPLRYCRVARARGLTALRHRRQCAAVMVDAVPSPQSTDRLATRAGLAVPLRRRSRRPRIGRPLLARRRSSHDSRVRGDGARTGEHHGHGRGPVRPRSGRFRPTRPTRHLGAHSAAESRFHARRHRLG